MTGTDFDWDAPTSSSDGAPADVEPPAQAPAPADVAAMSFENALAELEQIVQELERGELELDAAIGAYERGTQLRLHCEAKLKEARLRVERITLGDDGRPRSDPAAFD